MKCIFNSNLLVLLLTALLALPALALEERKFFSVDGSKSFEGTLSDYDAAKGMVKVLMKSGKTKQFSLNLLSKKDQDYIKQNADTLQIARNFDLRFKEFKEKTTLTKKGLVRTNTTPTGFEVQLYSRSKKVIEGVSVRYYFYYCVGSSSAEGPRHTPKRIKGELDFPKMYDQYTETRKTAQVNLIRESKKGVAPPVRIGGGGGGG